MVWILTDDPCEEDGDALLVADLAGVAEREQAGKAGRARRVDVDARGLAPSSFARASVSSPTTTGRPPVASIPSTTASQS